MYNLRKSTFLSRFNPETRKSDAGYRAAACTKSAGFVEGCGWSDVATRRLFNYHQLPAGALSFSIVGTVPNRVYYCVRIDDQYSKPWRTGE
jgi:hypothetical protein